MRFWVETRHFFKSLIGKRLDEEQFTMMGNNDLRTLTHGVGWHVYPNELYDNFDIEIGTLVFSFDKYLRIENYINKTHNIIFPISGFINLDSYGNIINALDLQIDGYWAEQRISDLLPNDYIFPGIKEN